MNKRRAFTLIELLVVIAIITLLISILVPALHMVKEKAKFIQCKANLRSHYLAMSLFLNDGDSKYPNSFNSLYDTQAAIDDGHDIRHHWHNEEISPSVNSKYTGPLWNYLETMKASMCPTFKSYAKLSGHTDEAAVAFKPQYAFSQNNYLGNGTIWCSERHPGR